MPWKNGGGVTTQIAIFPKGADLDSFGWRISMATVSENGPFSIFSGIDRSLAVLSGDGIELTIEGFGSHRVTRETLPLSFPADARTSARLIGGAIVDLNVMIRRGVFSHEMRRFQLHGVQAIETDADQTMVVCAEGSAEVSVSDITTKLEALDALLLEGPARFRLSADQSADVFVIEFRRMR